MDEKCAEQSRASQPWTSSRKPVAAHFASPRLHGCLPGRSSSTEAVPPRGDSGLLQRLLVTRTVPASAVRSKGGIHSGHPVEDLSENRCCSQLLGGTDLEKTLGRVWSIVEPGLESWVMKDAVIKHDLRR